MFRIVNLSVSIQETSVVRSLNLDLAPGTIHALMGANGSGKSSLALTLAGHPYYQVISGSADWKGISFLELSPEERARHGLFLAFQQPPSLAGVVSVRFLKEAYQAVKGVQIGLPEFIELLTPLLHQVGLPASAMHRPLHEGFSGGEKKRWELASMLLLQPAFAILDEIDSGLDIDGLKLVAQSIQKLRESNPEMTVVLITHYPRLLDYLQPDHIHIMAQGTIAASGGIELVHNLEQRGYDEYQANSSC
jgi:Fe-S cluster assembly ATP-binding protein